jgi:hypothetical protein
VKGSSERPSNIGACNTESSPLNINHQTRPALRYFTPHIAPNVLTTDIHLDCDFSTSNGRKPGDISEDAFELRVALMREMRERDVDVKVVDARQEIDAVTAELWRWVWFAMNRAQKR